MDTSDAGARPAASGDAASSMALLTGLVESALRSDYPPAPLRDGRRTGDSAGPAHRNPARENPAQINPGQEDLALPGSASDHVQQGQGTTWRGASFLMVGLIGLIVATAAAAVFYDRPGASQQRQELAARIASAQQSVAALEADVAELDAQVEAAAAAILGNDDDGRRLAERVADLEQQAGFTAIEGEGMTVTLSDGEAAGQLSRVLDRDVQVVVNALWESGAQAVAVNGMRLTARTAIRSAGEAIVVGYRPLAPPYQVVAVGAQPSAFARSDAARGLRVLEQQYGILSDVTSGVRLVPPAVGP